MTHFETTGRAQSNIIIIISYKWNHYTPMGNERTRIKYNNNTMENKNNDVSKFVDASTRVTYCVAPPLLPLQLLLLLLLTCLNGTNISRDCFCVCAVSTKVFPTRHQILRRTVGSSGDKNKKKKIHFIRFHIFFFILYYMYIFYV